MERHGRSELGHRVAVALGARLLRLAIGVVGKSCRLDRSTADELSALRARQEPTILVLWHRQLFLCCYLLSRELVRHGVPLTVLVSRSRDGDFGTRVGHLLGTRVVRGSSSHGGSAALRQLAREVRSGRWPVMIADGPRGPAGEAKAGPLALSRLTGASVTPLGLAAGHSWRIRSWDRTLVPRPFTRLSLAVGEPIHPGLPSLEEAEGLTRALDQAEQRARSIAGRSYGRTL